MALNITTSVPIRSFLKRFVAYHYGNSVDPFIVTETNNLGNYIRLLFTRTSLSGVNAAKSERKFNDVLRIQVPADIINQSKFVISMKHVTKLDRYLKKEFDNEIKRRIIIQEKFKMDHKDIVDEFLKEYDLADYISSDTILKHFRRNNGTKSSRRTLKRDL